MNALSTHPFLGSVLILAALSHIACIVLMLRLNKVSYGYEDQNGFHFINADDSIIVPVDEIRPSWVDSEIFDRLLDRGVQLRRS
jgi:hypothetical protein